MEQYISKSALVAEIERRTKEHHSGYLVCLKDILSFINTLEVKEVDLEKEIDDYTNTMEVWEIQEAPLTSIENAAKYFFELGLKAQKGEKV